MPTLIIVKLFSSMKVSKENNNNIKNYSIFSKIINSIIPKAELSQELSEKSFRVHCRRPDKWTSKIFINQFRFPTHNTKGDFHSKKYYKW